MRKRLPGAVNQLWLNLSHRHSLKRRRCASILSRTSVMAGSG